MRMKTVFLSMLTIAALASCTRQDFIDPNGGGTDPGGTGESMVIELTVSSTQLTKAQGLSTPEKDKKIKDITVFGVNKDKNAVISRKFFAFDEVEGEIPATVSVDFGTTEQTDAIYVIANVGDDLTGLGKPLNLSTVQALNKATASLIIPNPKGGNEKVAKQTEGNVLMSGYTAELEEGGAVVGGTAKANVQLNLIASKVILKSITREKAAPGVYGENYKFVGAMMTNVNTQAYYFAGEYPILPESQTPPSYIGAIEGPNGRGKIEKQFMSGASDETATKVKVLYQDLTEMAKGFETTKELNDIAYWYVFENDAEVSTTPTALQLHYLFKGANQTTPETNKYISVVFGNDGNPKLEPGKAYSVTIKFDANLSEGENPPGGDEPDKPALEGSVGVTVTPAKWADETNVNKPVE